MLIMHAAPRRSAVRLKCHDSSLFSPPPGRPPSKKVYRSLASEVQSSPLVHWQARHFESKKDSSAALHAASRRLQFSMPVSRASLPTAGDPRNRPFIHFLCASDLASNEKDIDRSSNALISVTFL
jgi:hypothetical protein